jgi:dihydroflavonol-4-reductase
MAGVGGGLCVVTGGGGHVGANLVRELLAQGIRTRVTDVREPRSLVGLGAEWVAADVRDPLAMRAAFDGADVVYHLAAVISVAGGLGGLVHQVNVDGVGCAAEAALDAGVRRFVHCSSVHAYDLAAVSKSTVDETGPRATRRRLPAYDQSKAAGERRLREVVGRGLDAVTVNPTGVIGAVDEGPSRVGTALLAAWQGRLPAVVAGGFDWVDVHDVVRGLLAAADSGRRGENYLLPGHRLSIRELVDAACAIADVQPPRVTVPMWLARLWSPAATAMARSNPDPLLYTADTLHALASFPRVDGAKAARELGHRPRPYRETLTDLYAYFVRTGTLAALSVRERPYRPGGARM